MLDRRLGLVLLGAGAFGIYATQGFWAPAEVEFTRAALPAPNAIELRPSVSTAFVTLPVDLGRVARRTEAALVQRLAMGLDTPDAQCNRKPPAADCAAGKLDGAVSLAGPVEAAMAGSSVRVRLPLKLETQQGGERAAIETAVSFVFKVQTESGLEIARVEQASTDGASGPHARAIRLVETRLKPLALTAQDELRAVLAALPVAAATQRAWNALTLPIELGAGSNTWLKAIPEVAGTGELAGLDGRPVFRIPIAARLSIETGERAASPARRPVIQGQVNTAGGVAIRFATPVRLDGLQAAVDTAFVKGGTFETRPDRFGPPVKVDIRKARVYPSVRQLAVEFELTASRFEGQSYRGKAHLVGRPVLDAERNLVTLADITFPNAAQREAGNAKAPANAPRLATDPFAGKLASIARIDIGRDVAEAAPRASSLLNQRIDERMTMSARLDQATPIAFELSREGAWLVSEVTGTLAIAYEGPDVALATAAGSERAAPTAGQRRIGQPELAAAAVVSAAAAAAGAAAATKASSGANATAVSVTPATTSAPGQAAAAAAAAGDAGTAPGAGGAKRPQVKPAMQRPAAKTAGKGEGTGQRKDWVPFAHNNGN